MKQIDKIIKSQSEPKDLNVLWLDTSNPEEYVLKEYDGAWKVIAGGGGGSSTETAVSYDEQTLTEAQQMQARKNQGLYYDFPEEIKTAKGRDAGETYGEYHKFITSDTPLPDDIKGIYDRDGSSMVYSIDDSQLPNYYLVNHNQYWPAFFLVILQESAEGTYANWPEGIYIRTAGLPSDYDRYSLEYAIKAEEVSKIPSKYLPESDAVQYVPQELTEAQKMQARKNQGLYCKYEGVGEKEVKTTTAECNTKLNTSDCIVKPKEWDMYQFRCRISDDTPSVSDLIGFYDYGGILQDISTLTITQENGYYTAVKPNMGDMGLRFFVVAETARLTIDGATTTWTKGIWVTAESYDTDLYIQDMQCSGVKYNGTVEIISKVPEEYIPDIPSGGIENFTLLSNPINLLSPVQKTNLFTVEDWEKIDGMKVFTTSFIAEPGNERDFLAVNDNGNISFYGKDGIEFILFPNPIASYISLYVINGGQIILSGLPNASMTSEELAALGFGTRGVNFGSWFNGHCHTVVILNGTNTVLVSGVVVLKSSYLEFWDDSNKYVVSIRNLQLTCEVTPR